VREPGATIGLARLPQPVQELLDAAATNASATAGEALELSADLARAGELRASVLRLEDEGDRITHDLRHRLPRSKLGASERGELLALAEDVDDVVDAFDGLVYELVRTPAALADARASFTALLRDLTRATMEAVTRLEDSDVRDREVARAHALAGEARVTFRRARVGAVDGTDVLSVLRTGTLVNAFERVVGACAKTLRSIELMSLNRA
jgi:hypothetical protein